MDKYYCDGATSSEEDNTSNVSAKDYLYDFMMAINNYDLYSQKKLIRYATKVCYHHDFHNPDLKKLNYKKFCGELHRLELDGTLDLSEPIDKISH
jgi:hypothetical protein